MTNSNKYAKNKKNKRLKKQKLRKSNLFFHLILIKLEKELKVKIKSEQTKFLFTNYSTLHF
jgi:hypothetical protein